ncbi:hypothetical protein BDN72DRAFT_833885 [Pluteus cervinus]|uniref:Uncharacterized protein n=1 Tax=Pluteus cervinus TaxID=181527 RepID=A0ACD3B813_9AGAR|nr:hypothetical protein BDN72DRAFT_833885 [Pluteus cervinus]
MPTATATTTTTLSTTFMTSPFIPQIPVKAAKLRPVEATLQALYTRAAHAFILRDTPLTYSLLKEAFELLHPPPFSSTYNSALLASDPLAASRRKWDILRITLESTVYTSPPPSHDPGFPENLRALLAQSAQSLITNAYQRSLRLFTPGGDAASRRGDATHLPAAVLVTLAHASLRTDCPDVGRLIIEEWLARRQGSRFVGEVRSDTSADGYDKVLDLYCLQVLPRLDQWDYADEFLSYESELQPSIRQNLKESLKQLHGRRVESTSKSQSSIAGSISNDITPTPSGPTSPRPQSPSPSISSSSSSSSFSTTSTHTVVPPTPRASRVNREGQQAFTALTRLSSKMPSSSSDSSRRSSMSDESTSTVTAKPHTNGHGNSASRINGNGIAIPRPPLTSRGKPNPNPIIRDHSPSPARNGRKLSPGESSSTPTSRSGSRLGRVPFSVQLQNQYDSEHASSSSSSNGVRRMGMSTYEVVKDLLRPYFKSKRWTSLLVVLVLVPVLSLIVRWRRQRWRSTGVGQGQGQSAQRMVSHAEMVKRRLQAVSSTNNSAMGAVTNLGRELVRAVLDTVRMAGSGLV